MIQFFYNFITREVRCLVEPVCTLAALMHRVEDLYCWLSFEHHM